MVVPNSPKTLSAKSRKTWRELLAAHEFADHERIVLERALEWFDRSDAAAAQATSADGAERARLEKLALDAATAGLRFWRSLKWPSPVGVRRPGRPSGAEWSRARREAAERLARLA